MIDIIAIVTLLVGIIIAFYRNWKAEQRLAENFARSVRIHLLQAEGLLSDSQLYVLTGKSSNK
jgi:hypothetical protein